MPIEVKRIYEDDLSTDRLRILVDRVWPRGISKEKANLDHWLKEVAPSTELRKWFAHDPTKYAEFKERYKKELQTGVQQEALEQLKELTKLHNKKVCLLYGAKDETHNQANVLKEILDYP